MSHQVQRFIISHVLITQSETKVTNVVDLTGTFEQAEEVRAQYEAWGGGLFRVTAVRKDAHVYAPIVTVRTPRTSV